MPSSALKKKNTSINSSHPLISYAVFLLKRKTNDIPNLLSLFYIIFFCCLFFFFNDTATTEIYTLSLHDALPILNSSHTLISYAVFCLAIQISPAAHSVVLAPV